MFVKCFHKWVSGICIFKCEVVNTNLFTDNTVQKFDCSWKGVFYFTYLFIPAHKDRLSKASWNWCWKFWLSLGWSKFISGWLMYTALCTSQLFTYISFATRRFRAFSTTFACHPKHIYRWKYVELNLTHYFGRVVSLSYIFKLTLKSFSFFAPKLDMFQ